MASGMSPKSPFSHVRSQLGGDSRAKSRSANASAAAIGEDSSEIRQDSTGASESVRDPDLLGPPLSINSVQDAPFKPARSDQTGLSMKKRRKRRSRRCHDSFGVVSAGNSKDGSSDQHVRPRLTSSSVPDLRHQRSPRRPLSEAGQLLMRQELQALHAAYRRASADRNVASQRRASLSKKLRRWTMPSKSASTRGLSSLPTPTASTAMIPRRDQQSNPVSAVAPESLHDATTNSDAASGRETPAMITLRRATIKKGQSTIPRRASLRPHAIISFPAPKFNRTTSTYFSSFFGRDYPQVHNQGDEIIQSGVRQSSWNTGRDQIPSLQNASVGVDQVQLTANTIAAPAVTQVEVVPLAHSRGDHRELRTHSTQPRRCSTMIISGSSVHEIIWDENVTSGSEEGSSSADGSRRTLISPQASSIAGLHRRQSALVDKLEAQLRNNEQRKVVADSARAKRSPLLAEQGAGRPSILSRLPCLSAGSPAEDENCGHETPPLDLKPQLDHDLPADATQHFSLLQDADLSSSIIEPVGFFPPLGGSAGNSSGSSFSVGRTELRQLRRGVQIEERTDDPLQPMIVYKDKQKARPRRRSSLQVDFGTPSMSDPHAVAGRALGQSRHIRRKSRIADSLEQSAGIFSRKTSTVGPVRFGGYHGEGVSLMSDSGDIGDDDDNEHDQDGCDSCTSQCGDSVDSRRDSDGRGHHQTRSWSWSWSGIGDDGGAGAHSSSGGGGNIAHAGIFSRPTSVQEVIDSIETMNAHGRSTNEHGRDEHAAATVVGDEEAVLLRGPGSGLVRRDTPRCYPAVRSPRTCRGGGGRKGDGLGSGMQKFLSEVDEAEEEDAAAAAAAADADGLDGSPSVLGSPVFL